MLIGIKKLILIYGKSSSKRSTTILSSAYAKAVSEKTNFLLHKLPLDSLSKSLLFNDNGIIHKLFEQLNEVSYVEEDKQEIIDSQLHDQLKIETRPCVLHSKHAIF